MKIPMTILGCCLSMTILLAQHLKKFTDDHSVQRYYARKGDNVIFSCDSVMLLNRKTQRTVDSVYAQLHLRFIKLLAMNDSSKALYEKLVEDKTIQYEDQKKLFQSLYDSTLHQQQYVNQKLDDVQQYLTSSKINLAAATNDIQQASVNIRQAKKQKAKGKIVYGLLGFGLGMVSGVLLYTRF